MDIEDILTMSPEKFAEAWNNDRDAVITTCYDALGITHETIDPETPSE